MIMHITAKFLHLERGEKLPPKIILYTRHLRVCGVLTDFGTSSTKKREKQAPLKWAPPPKKGGGSLK